jgi:hypothetical protein
MTLTEVIAELKQGRKPALLPVENAEGTGFAEEGVAMRAALCARLALRLRPSSAPRAQAYAARCGASGARRGVWSQGRHTREIT